MSLPPKSSPPKSSSPKSSPPSNSQTSASRSNPIGSDDSSNRFVLVLGTATADLWSDLPQDLQHSLFERAIVLGHKSERDESLREQLAKFLHDHHTRTMAR